MRFAIVGAGGMGCAVAAFLLRAGHDAVLIGRDAAKAERIRARGLTIEPPNGAPFTVRPAITADPGSLPAASVDAVIVLTKTYDTQAAVDRCRHILAPGGCAMTIQNGLGNEIPVAAAFGAARTLYGVTTIGGRALEPDRIALTGLTAEGRSVSEIGPCDPDCDLEGARRAAAAMTESRLPTEVHPDVRPAVWTKLALAVQSPVGSVTRRGVSEVWAAEEGRAVLRAMIEETLACAAAEGVRLDHDAVWARCRATWEGTGPYLTSMAVDVLNKRRTEIDAIAGEVLKRGLAHGLAMPTHTTLVGLVRFIESTYDSVAA